MYHVSTLSNGLKVATAPMPHMNSVSVGIWVAIGSRYEAPPVSGACHFIEHLLFKGTRRRSAREISESVEGIGGYLNAFTGEESTCYHARASRERFDELLDVLADMFLGSLFRPIDISRERNVIKEEIAMYRDDPQQHVQELLNGLLWPRHALGRPITGTEKSLDFLNRHRLVKFLQRHYLAQNTIISVAGNITHRQVLKAVRRVALRFPSGSAPRFEPAAITQQQPQIKLLSRKMEQTQVALGIRACSRHDERRFALRLLNTILGENMSSRLFQSLREDHGLVYSVYSSPSFFHDTGDLVISAGMDTDKLERTLRLIVAELRRMTLRAPSKKELARARDYVIGQMDLSLESTDNRMNWLGEQLAGYQRVEPISVIKKKLFAVTGPEIMQAALSFFRPERVNLALISQLKNAQHLLPLLNI
jgi:predicted Zn-dependent peptidase